MTSPLLPYANGYLLISKKSTPTIENGRIVTTVDDEYLVQCYLVRQQATGTTTGADYIPTQSTNGEVVPGSSGLVYLYAGYALRYASAPAGYEAGDSISNGLLWTAITNESIPEWLVIGDECKHVQGAEQVKHCKIERLSGRYGNNGIDKIINKEIGGIPIVVRSGEVID